MIRILITYVASDPDDEYYQNVSLYVEIPDNELLTYVSQIISYGFAMSAENDSTEFIPPNAIRSILVDRPIQILGGGLAGATPIMEQRYE